MRLLALFQPVSPSYLEELSGLPADRARAAITMLSNVSAVSSSESQLMFAHASLVEFHLQNKIIQRDTDIGVFQFGDETAERDSLLKQNFMPPRDLHLVTTGAKTIVLGDRGAGKSAIFRALQDLNGTAANPTNSTGPLTITSVSQDPASFVQQMTADDSVTSSASAPPSLPAFR